MAPGIVMHDDDFRYCNHRLFTLEEREKRLKLFMIIQNRIKEIKEAEMNQN